MDIDTSFKSKRKDSLYFGFRPIADRSFLVMPTAITGSVYEYDMYDKITICIDYSDNNVIK